MRDRFDRFSKECQFVKHCFETALKSTLSAQIHVTHYSCGGRSYLIHMWADVLFSNDPGSDPPWDVLWGRRRFARGRLTRPRADIQDAAPAGLGQAIKDK
jgi:hypothetical protein